MKQQFFISYFSIASFEDGQLLSVNVTLEITSYHCPETVRQLLPRCTDGNPEKQDQARPRFNFEFFNSLIFSLVLVSILVHRCIQSNPPVALKVWRWFVRFLSCFFEFVSPLINPFFITLVTFWVTTPSHFSSQEQWWTPRRIWWSLGHFIIRINKMRVLDQEKIKHRYNCNEENFGRVYFRCARMWVRGKGYEMNIWSK